MHHIKRMLTLLLCAALLLGAAPLAAAQAAVHKGIAVYVNGEFNPLYAYNIDGRNYFRLRDVALLLSGTSSAFDVRYDATSNRVLLTTGRSYSVPEGVEPRSSNRTNPVQLPSTSTVWLDGSPITLQGYNIDNDNYFALRDLAELFSVLVVYDAQNDLIRLTTRAPAGSSRMLSPLGVRAVDNRGTAAYQRWSKPLSSFLYRREDGGLNAVLAQDGAVHVLELNGRYQVTSTREITSELPLFGGFYAGESGLYLLFGRENKQEIDSREVLRLVRYDQGFNRVDSLSLSGYQTGVTLPFNAGSCRMSEREGELVVHTSREWYKLADGINHQTQLTLVVDTREGLALQNFVGHFQENHVGHSMDQFVAHDQAAHYLLDHGDSDPRSLVLHRSRPDGGYDEIDLYPIEGRTGANATGVTPGGFALSSTHCLAAFNAIDQSTATAFNHYEVRGPTANQRNIALSAVDKSLEGGVLTRILGRYIGGDKTPGTPRLVQLEDDRFALLWQEFDLETGARGSLISQLVDGSGQAVGSPGSHSGYDLTDCQPILRGGQLVWLSEAHGVLTVFALPVSAL